MKLKNIIIMMGPPGSGKGTQGEKIAKYLNYARFSMGELFRECAKQDTELGRRIKTTIDQGIIVPDEDAKELFIQEFDKFADWEGVVLDGFPRTKGQLEVVDELAKKYNIESVRVVFLEVDKEKLIDRLSKRKTCTKCQAVYHPDSGEAKSNICSVCRGQLVVRDDDNPEGVARRFDEYLKKTADVKSHYESRGVMIKIDGDHSIEDVHKVIVEKLKI